MLSIVAAIAAGWVALMGAAGAAGRMALATEFREAQCRVDWMVRDADRDLAAMQGELGFLEESHAALEAALSDPVMLDAAAREAMEARAWRVRDAIEDMRFRIETHPEDIAYLTGRAGDTAMLYPWHRAITDAVLFPMRRTGADGFVARGLLHDAPTVRARFERFLDAEAGLAGEASAAWPVLHDTVAACIALGLLAWLVLAGREGFSCRPA